MSQRESSKHDFTFFQLGERLTQIVKDSPGQQLFGSQLGQRLFPPEAELLRQTGTRLALVLRDYAPLLGIVGRAGGDVIWGIPTSESAPDVDPRDSQDNAGAHLPGNVAWEEFSARNFRSLRNVQMTLTRITVLVGRNGAGKSNVLDALYRTSRLTTRNPIHVFSERNAPSQVAGRWAVESGFVLEAKAKNWNFQYTSGNPFEAPLALPFKVQLGKPPQPLRTITFTPLRDIFGGALHLRLDAQALAEPCWSEAEQPYLRQDGYGLGAVLSWVMLMDRPRFETILQRVRVLVPQIQDLRTPPVRIDTPDGTVRMGFRIEAQMKGVGWVSAYQLSEGTLLAIGLHTLLSEPSPPHILLLDDVDRALHPHAQRALIQQLMSLASPKMLIVCSTHSPYILDPLPVESVRVVGLAVDGSTKVRRLDEHPKWSKQEGQMTPAEFWQYVGDGSWPGDEV